MKSNFTFLFFIAIVLSASQCSNNIEGTIIKGKIIGADNMNVYFDQTSIDNVNTVLAQSKADGSGNFSFAFPEGLSPDIYRVRFGVKYARLIINGKEKEVEISGDLTNLSKYQIEFKGSESSQEYNTAMQQYISRKMPIAEIQAFVSEADPLVSMQFAMKTLGPRPEFATIHSIVSKRVSDMYPEAPYSEKYKNVVTGLHKQMALRNAQSKIRIGELAPDISLPDPDGKMMSLSDLKGKVVLLDFWASWCGPCRKANPHVVKTYLKYKDKGFTVFSVSLDGLDARSKKRLKTDADIKRMTASSMSRWKAAIIKDQLTWDSHVSDLKKWDSKPAAIYGVRSIPKTFLIDRDGRIVALNPRYNLEEELLKVL